MKSSEYVDKCRKDYSYYVIHERALPSIKDGLKNSGRRVLWMARNGSKFKSATLAGVTMEIHPHDAPEDAVNALAAHHGNNIPLLTGYGDFGSRTAPNVYGASRYTSVKVSDFTKDAVFVDMDLIPMTSNYDKTTEEPVHFLPLIPICLVNQVEGIAIGYACNILPRRLDDIIDSQIKTLRGIRERKDPPIYIKSLNQTSYDSVMTDKDRLRWLFKGEYTKKGRRINITNIAYGSPYSKLESHLQSLLADGKITNFIDSSTDQIDISFTLVKDEPNIEKLESLIGIKDSSIENINLTDGADQILANVTYREIIERFTNWRLEYFKLRYQRLLAAEQKISRRWQDLITAIDNNAGDRIRSMKNKTEFSTWLKSIGVRDVEYICNISIYRFSLNEKKKALNALKESKKLCDQYSNLVNDPKLRVAQYIKELTQLKQKYGTKKGP